MKRALGSAVLAITAAALAGCASTGSTTAASAPSSEPSAAPSSAPSSEPSAEPSAAPCTTKACIAAVMDQDAVGIVAENMSVVTGAKCKPSTVRHNPGNTWTARCTITYSDDSTGRGLVTLLPDQGKIAFQPDGT